MNLRTALSSLRRELKSEEGATGAPELLVADRQYIRLNPAVVTTDVRRFEEELRRAARETEASAKIAAFSQAIALYRGPLLPGFYDDWVLAERERLQMLQTRALRGLVAAHISLGEGDRALEYAYEVLKLEPLDEENHAEVMRLHAAAGRTVAVTRQFRELQRRLKEELDAEPSEGIQALYNRLLRERPASTSPSASEEGETASSPSPQAPVSLFLPFRCHNARWLRCLSRSPASLAGKTRFSASFVG
jgi:DNA-binding SARP family transcriptional activator